MANRRFLLVSDFDQTLSFNDSGLVLSEMLGIVGFESKVSGLSRLNLVQEGAELAYLLRHDPEFRRVRRSDLVEVGKRVRLKRNIGALVQLLAAGIDGLIFDFYVVSAAPEEVVHSALEGLMPRSHIIGTRFGYDAAGEIDSIVQVAAGYGKVFALDALSVAVPILEELAGYDSERVRALFDRAGFVIQEWDRARTDWLTIGGDATREVVSA